MLKHEIITFTMPDGVKHRVRTPATMPAWARRNMRSKYMPHTGAKQRDKSWRRDYEWPNMGYDDDGYPLDRPGGPIIHTHSTRMRHHDI